MPSAAVRLDDLYTWLLAELLLEVTVFVCCEHQMSTCTSNTRHRVQHRLSRGGPHARRSEVQPLVHVHACFGADMPSRRAFVHHLQWW